jgi:hypothetical protein
MSPRPLRDAVPTVRDWGQGFERYAASGVGLTEQGPSLFLADMSQNVLLPGASLSIWTEP